MYFSKLFAEIWRLYVTDGAPSSGAHNIVKTDVQAWGAIVEAQVQLASIAATDATGSDVNTAQAVFGSSGDALTVEADTTYELEALYWITRAAGTTSHTTAVLFGGDATLTSIIYLAQVSNPTGNALGTVSQIMGAAATALTVTSANTSATENLMIRLRGIVRVDAGGTLIPQFQYSAAPGGAPTTKAGSYFKVRKLGDGSVATVGPWA
jgi:hypothetical protein